MANAVSGRGLRENRAQWISVVVIVLALGGIAAGLADSMVVGKWFAAALCGLLVVILGFAAVTLRTLRAFLNKTRLHLHSAVRHGLANLYRPGNQSAAVLAALGTGVMLILSVFLMQHAIVNRMNSDAATSAANIFLIDISQDEVQGVKELLLHQHGRREEIRGDPYCFGADYGHRWRAGGSAKGEELSEALAVVGFCYMGGFGAGRRESFAGEVVAEETMRTVWRWWITLRAG